MSSDNLSGITWRSSWDIFWHIFWHFIWHIFWQFFWCDLAPFLSCLLAVILAFYLAYIWHFIWRIFWHSFFFLAFDLASLPIFFWRSFWPIILRLLWHSFWHILWRCIWRSFWVISRNILTIFLWIFCFWHSIWHIFWRYFLRIFLAYLLAYFLALSSSILSGVCDVEVRRCALKSRGPGWGPALPTAMKSWPRGWQLKKKGEEEKEAGRILITFNGSHLAGGEQVGPSTDAKFKYIDGDKKLDVFLCMEEWKQQTDYHPKKCNDPITKQKKKKIHPQKLSMDICCNVAISDPAMLAMLSVITSGGLTT